MENKNGHSKEYWDMHQAVMEAIKHSKPSPETEKRLEKLEKQLNKAKK